MNLFLNIIERGVIHFFSSFSIVVMVFFALRYGYLKLPKVRRFFEYQISYNHFIVASALLVFAFSTLREAYDVAHGQHLVKAFTDYTSWFLGTGCSAFGIYRLMHLPTLPKE